MQQKTPEKGFGVIEIIILTVVVISLVIGGWFVWQRDQTSEQVVDSNNAQQSDSVATDSEKSTGQDTSPPAQEETAYLEVKEWGVKVALPEGMDGVVTYKMGELHIDPDGNQIQAAKILVATSILPGNQCAVSATTVGQASESGAQFIRSENSKPFNAARYKWTFKENILKADEFNYHLNYVTPECIGSATDKIESLQSALVSLRRVG